MNILKWYSVIMLIPIVYSAIKGMIKENKKEKIFVEFFMAVGYMIVILYLILN